MFRCLAELDLDERDEAGERLLDDLGVGVAKDRVALALVGLGARLAELRELGLDDERAELLLRLLEAVDLDDPPVAVRR